MCIGILNGKWTIDKRTKTGRHTETRRAFDTILAISILPNKRYCWHLLRSMYSMTRSLPPHANALLSNAMRLSWMAENHASPSKSCKNWAAHSLTSQRDRRYRAQNKAGGLGYGTALPAGARASNSCFNLYGWRDASPEKVCREMSMHHLHACEWGRAESDLMPPQRQALVPGRPLPSLSPCWRGTSRFRLHRVGDVKTFMRPV